MVKGPKISVVIPVYNVADLVTESYNPFLYFRF